MGKDGKMMDSYICVPCWERTKKIRGNLELDLERLMSAINLEDFNI